MTFRELGRTATGLRFWKDEANFRIQFSKGNAMFVSCQLLLQIRTRQKKKMNKAETVGLAGDLQAEQRAGGKSFC